MRASEHFAPRKGTRALAGGLAAVFAVLAAVTGVSAYTGHEPGLAIFAAAIGAVSLLFRTPMTRLSDRVITLTDAGLELVPREGAPVFIGWGQVAGLRLSQFRAGAKVLGQGDETLATIDYQLQGVGRLLREVLCRGVLPKRQVTLPFEGGRQFSGAFVAFAALALLAAAGFGGMIWSQTGSPAGLVLPAIFLVAAVVGRSVGTRGIFVDRTGVAIERGWKRMEYPWALLEGAALVFLRGPKGQMWPAVGLKHRGGDWEAVRATGLDPVECLAAVYATDPARIIAPPDRLVPGRGGPFSNRYVEGKPGLRGLLG